MLLFLSLVVFVLGFHFVLRFVMFPLGEFVCTCA